MVYVTPVCITRAYAGQSVGAVSTASERILATAEDHEQQSSPEEEQPRLSAGSVGQFMLMTVGEERTPE